MSFAWARLGADEAHSTEASLLLNTLSVGLITLSAPSAEEPCVLRALNDRASALLAPQLATLTSVTSAQEHTKGQEHTQAERSVSVRFEELFPSAQLPRLLKRLERGRVAEFMCELTEEGRALPVRAVLRSLGEGGELLIELHDHSAVQQSEMMLASYSELIEKKTRSLAREQRRVERLLFNVLPEKCVNELRSYGRTKPERFHEVSVLFLDFVGFTELSQRMSTERLFNELNELFTAFDAIITEHQCERIKTIGDAYLAVCGMPDRVQGHAELISSAAFKMRAFVEERNRTHQTTWRCRMGLHTGEVTGGVVGRLKYIYDVFGDGVNTASRMESNSEPMKINLSVALRERLGPAYQVTSRGMIDVKGKGLMEMFFLDNIQGEPCAERLRPHIPQQETIDEDVSIF